MIFIFSHRGLNFDRTHFPAESSYAAFSKLTELGFGLEVDPQLTRDGQFVMLHKNHDVHDATSGKLDGSIIDFTAEKLRESGLATLEDIIELTKSIKYKPALALHLKGANQNETNIKLLVNSLQKFDVTSFLIFDLTPKAASLMKEIEPKLQLAPSIAHPFDIARYNQATSETLLSVSEALQHKEIYDWVWLDEWDRTDEQDGTKILYSLETFTLLRNAGYKIALVTPELHATSPGLLGGESHQDAQDKERLFNRIKDIISLKPDAVCTDYPETVQQMILSN